VTTAVTHEPKRASFLRRETETPILKFVVAKGMSYRRRVAIVVLLVLLGFGLQIALLHALVGLPFLLAALVFTWVRGFDEKLDRRRMRANQAWESAKVERLGDILTLDRKMRSWDASLTDISSPVGALLLLLVIGALVLTWFLLRRDWPAIAGIAVLDGALLLVPQWFNGMRFIQRRGDLVLKASHVQAVLRGCGEADLGGGVLGIRMRVGGRVGERTPLDFKLVVTYPDGPQGFHGVQAQVVINRVQGTGFPYFYACLVAEAGRGLLERGRPERLPPDVIVETQGQGKAGGRDKSKAETREHGAGEEAVEVIVIRQRTSRTSGYHTKVPRSTAILRTALRAAARFVETSRKA